MCGSGLGLMTKYSPWFNDLEPMDLGVSGKEAALAGGVVIPPPRSLEVGREATPASGVVKRSLRS